MIVKHLKDILGTKAHAAGEGWESRRILLAADGLGYSLHDTLVSEGAALFTIERITWLETQPITFAKLHYFSGYQMTSRL